VRGLLMAKSVQKPMPRHIPFKELKLCPQCGERNLKKVHDQKYGGKEGIYRLVIYRCPNGHETRVRQLVVSQPHMKDGDWWTS
jgi:hypothetical protein